MIDCVICGEELQGSQRKFCSEACKQRDKYQRQKGERCADCKRPMKPIPVIGGYSELCPLCSKSR